MARPDRHSGWWAMLPLDEVGSVVEFMLWGTPNSMIPTPAKVCNMLAELAARDDVGDPIAQAAMVQCRDLLKLKIDIRH